MKELATILNLNLIDKIIYLVYGIITVLWIWGILRTAKDIYNRTDNIFLEILSILLVTILGPLGLLYYFIIRPTGYKRDRNGWREAILVNTIQCPSCGTLNPKENNYCLECGEKIKIECKECKKNYPIDYNFCPNCGAPNIDQL